MSYQRIHEGWKRYLNETARELTEIDSDETSKEYMKYHGPFTSAIQKGDPATAEKLLAHLEVVVFKGAVLEIGAAAPGGGSIIPSDDLYNLSRQMHEAGPQWCGVVANYMNKHLERIENHTAPGQGEKSVAGMGRQGAPYGKRRLIAETLRHRCNR